MDPAKTLVEAIQHSAPGEIDDAVCIGFVTVAEWACADGCRYLTLVNGDANGEPLPFWQVDGYLSNAPSNED